MERALSMDEVPEPPGRSPAGLVGELPRVRRLLARLLGRTGRGGADADDLSQEVALRAVRYGQAFDPRRPLGPWLRRAAVRAWLDEARRAARRPASLGDELPEGAHEVPDRLAEREELAQLLAALTGRERDVLLRFHAGGEPVAHIARALRCPAGTVKSHLHRARRKLARQRGEDAR